VLLVEDHELLAQSLRIALTADGVDARIAPLTSRTDVLSDVERLRPRVVLLDLDLGPVLGHGVDLVAPISARGADVLIVTGTPDRILIATALESGAVGFIGKSRPFDELMAAIRAVLAGGPVIAEPDRQELLGELRRHRRETAARQAPFERLTPRERLVLRALADGRTVDRIAADWVVSPATVRTQVRAILTKLDVGTQLAAVALARRDGWLDGH
jgi:DNA-binding NarL/FixJ family response regulator